MGYTFSFADNETYGTDDINAAFGRLIQSGVGFYSGNTNLIAGMNETTADYLESGVNLDGCQAELLAEDGTVKIHPGWAFFQDGSTITIDAAGVTLPYASGSPNYIYLLRDPARNMAEPVISTEAGSGDFVPIAQISAGGVLTDTRKFAVSKIAPNAANVYLERGIPDITLTSSMDTTVPIATFDAGGAWFRYILVTHEKGKAIPGAYQKMEDGVKTEFIKPYPGSDYDHSRLAFQKRGQYIDVYAKLAIPGGESYSYQFVIC